MWIDGKNYKSLNFTMLEVKLKNQEKDQTCRTNFIPNYEIGEIIAITFKKGFLYLAKVKDFYPKQLKNITEKEARRDGFSSILRMQKAILELNKIKSLNHWCFITIFKAIPTIFDYLCE